MPIKTEPIFLLTRPPQKPDTSGITEMTDAIRKSSAAASAAAKAQKSLATAATAVTKAVTDATVSFDELHVAGKDETTQKKTSSGSSSSSRKTAKEAEETQTIWERCRDALEAIFAQIRARIEKLAVLYGPTVRAWTDAFATLRESTAGAFESMFQTARSLWNDTLAPLGNYVMREFAPHIVNALSQVIAPALATVGSLAANVLADGFAAAAGVLSDAVDTLIIPALSAVRETVVGLCAGLLETWETYGPSLLEGISAFFESINTLWNTFYTEWIQPAFEALAGIIDGLWQEHLAPLWQSFTNLLAELGLLLLDVWNNILAPFLQRLTEIFAPAISAVFSGAATAVRGLLETFSAVALSIVEALRGLVEFLAGVFTGDWSRAWEGIKAIVQNVWDAIVGLVKGAVNLVIDCINALVSGVAAAVNGIIGALNTIQVTIPKWVPVYGGREFGVNLPGVSAPQIPRLAQGAVIPPNAAFLAVLGDQTHGRNLEAPESLIRQIVREESGGPLMFEAQQPIEVLLDSDVLYRAVARVKARRGVTVGGAFADAY